MVKAWGGFACVLTTYMLTNSAADSSYVLSRLKVSVYSHEATLEGSNPSVLIFFSGGFFFSRFPNRG